VSLEVHLVTPEREVWTGEVQMLIAHGTDGDVGILGGHAPLLVQLEIAPLRLELGDGTWLRAVVDGGFLHVSTDEGGTRADVLATVAELAAEIDVEAARERLAEAERAAAAVDGDDAVAAAEIAKAQARITVAG
jgi:F-type H+-transporting ATPase subunit epsilon